MFVGITNTPRDYAWGSHGAISELLGRPASGAPEAELWLGAHPGSPSRIIDPTQTGGATDLAAWIAVDPAVALGDGTMSRLPFLLKILAAGSPLSLQAHPTAEQAIAGFARENAAGIPLDAAERNYKDPYPKPELIYALSETFDALCGFRPAAAIRQTIGRLIELDAASTEPRPAPLQHWLERTGTSDSLRGVFEWLISGGAGVRPLVDRVVELARSNPIEFSTVAGLAAAYPGDPGIVISLMLNRVTLTHGQALYLPAGNIHAYLAGVGVELMTASDNVLRGGLTPKHVDVDELLAVLDFTPAAVPYLPGEPLGGAVIVFRPDSVDFELLAIAGRGSVDLHGPGIVLCERGQFEVTGRVSSRSLAAGESVYITPDEGELAFEGEGAAFLAMSR